MHVVPVVSCAPRVPHALNENRKPNGYVNNGLQESANSRANFCDTLDRQRIRAKTQVAFHVTIELRNDDDGLELFDQRDAKHSAPREAQEREA